MKKCKFCHRGLNKQIHLKIVFTRFLSRLLRDDELMVQFAARVYRNISYTDIGHKQFTSGDPYQSPRPSKE